MATPARWSNPEGWNRPARVAFAGMSEVNHQDPAQQVVLEGDAEVVPAAAYTEAGQVDPKISRCRCRRGGLCEAAVRQ